MMNTTGPSWLARRALFALTLTASCAADPKEPIRAPPPDPGELMIGDLEGRLSRAQTAHIKAKLACEGAVNAELDAELHLASNQRVLLVVDGTFEGKRAKGQLRSDGNKMFINEGVGKAVPPELRDAIVLGFTRMGLMHNAALLVGAETPDHAEGGVHNWVRLERMRSGTPATQIAFDVAIKKSIVGDGELQLDTEGRPVVRTQRVRLDVGDMTVRERYDVFTIDQPIDDALFCTQGACLQEATPAPDPG